MPNKKKKFIDKKNAVTFHLVHRGQKDPLQASEDASQRVLLPVAEKERLKAKQEEQQKYGVFFDDDYDYLQHLKDVDEINEVEPIQEHISFRQKRPPPPPDEDVETENPKSVKIQLPSSLFGSEIESKVGLLNKAAPSSGPKLDWDPDVVAALDDDFDFEDPDNQLEDDFVITANQDAEEGGELGAEDDKDGKRRVHFDSDDDDSDYLPSDEAEMSDRGDDRSGFSFEDEETKTRFTNYSMTSSVIKRTEGLSLLDDRFEKLYEQYDDDEIGALDHEEIDGSIQPESKILQSMMEQFEKDQDRPKLKDVVEKAGDNNIDDEEEEDSDEVERDLVKMTIRQPEEKWDCESILSTYSNLYNHPKVIVEPKKHKKIQLDDKTDLPVTSISERGLTRKEIDMEFTAKDRADRACTYRPKDESAEERKARKKAIKEERRERRAEKKATKEAFKEEQIKQAKEQINAHRTECIRMS